MVKRMWGWPMLDVDDARPRSKMYDLLSESRGMQVIGAQIQSVVIN